LDVGLTITEGISTVTSMILLSLGFITPVQSTRVCPVAQG
jgi:hypothetical protein